MKTFFTKNYLIFWSSFLLSLKSSPFWREQEIFFFLLHENWKQGPAHIWKFHCPLTKRTHLLFTEIPEWMEFSFGLCFFNKSKGTEGNAFYSDIRKYNKQGHWHSCCVLVRFWILSGRLSLASFNCVCSFEPKANFLHNYLQWCICYSFRSFPAAPVFFLFWFILWEFWFLCFL